MTRSPSLFPALWALSLATGLGLPAWAQKHDADGPHQQHRQAKPNPKKQQAKPPRAAEKPTKNDMQGRHDMHGQHHPPMHASALPGGIAIGAYFQSHQIEAARSYYSRPENMGFCPPGLAKKGTGCLPPGQAKSWRKGVALPASVIYYDVPRSVVLSLGIPPQGYKYVRVASDILLIAIGTGLVVDAIEDLVR